MVRVGQVARATPLVPAVVIGLAEAARALARSVLARPDESLEKLRALAGDDWFVVLGEADDLPWADGALYLGREPTAPELFLPCATGPDVPVALLQSALARHFRSTLPSPPLAISLQPPLLLSLAAANKPSRERLTAWLTAQEAP